MKKHFSLLAMAALAAFSLTSCSDDEDDNNFVVCPVETSYGVFVVNGGNKSGGIEGSLTYYDYGTQHATQNVYQTANGVALGETPNHAVVYGSKIYIVGSGESTIFVADKNTLKAVANIKVEVDGKTATPRQAVADYGYVYVSTYSNAVIAIDTLTNTISKTFKSGFYSEGMAIYKQFLYVADSNYGKGKQDESYPSISIIDLQTGKTSVFTNDLINNPVDVKIAGDRMFILDSGHYDDNWNQIGAGVYEVDNGEVTRRADATEMAVCGNKVYVINAPYTYPATEPTYKVFDTTTDALTTLCDGTDIEYPGKISTDPVTGQVYITSYHIGSSGFADYKGAGYCVIYDSNGVKLGQFDCGTGAGYVVPNISVDYVQTPQ